MGYVYCPTLGSSGWLTYTKWLTIVIQCYKEKLAKESLYLTLPFPLHKCKHKFDQNYFPDTRNERDTEIDIYNKGPLIQINETLRGPRKTACI